MRRPPRLLRRAAAIALLAAAGLVLHTNIVRPLGLMLEGSRERLTEGLHEQARLRAALGALREAQGGEVPPDPTPQRWSGPSEPVVASRVQEVLQGLAATAGVTLSSVTWLEPGELAGIPALRLRLETAGSYPALVGFLLRVERARPFLFVETAAVTARPAYGEQSEPLVDARLELAAYTEVAIP